MRRAVITTSVAGAVLALAVTGSADARAHHARRHHASSKAHARIERFGPGKPGAQPGSHKPSGASLSSGAKSAEASEAAGTVASFENGVLTLALNDGSTVSGKVTDRTEIKCEPPQPTATAADHSSGDQADSGGDGAPDERTSPGVEAESGAGNENEQGDNQDEQEQHASCGVSALVPGAEVREAELRVSSSGATFIDIELIG